MTENMTLDCPTQPQRGLGSKEITTLIIPIGVVASQRRQKEGDMKIFTIEGGKVAEGAKAYSLILQGAGVTVPVVSVGEEGRGKRLVTIPVQLTAAQYAEWAAEGKTWVLYANLGETRKGALKLIATEGNNPKDMDCVCVFRTEIGFRGGNSHTGDATGEVAKPVKFFDSSDREVDTHLPFPGTTIAIGVIAQGAAGYAGSGEQLIAIMPADSIFRTAYSGRMYGAPDEHFYRWDSKVLLGGLTQEERVVLDIF